MYDATLFAIRRAETASNIISTLDLTAGSYGVATVHRAENTDDAENLGAVVAFLRDQARTQPIILPLHPRTRQIADKMGVDFGPLRVIGPVGYLDMTQLLHAASCVFTDSGGLQKEAYFHRVPCTTLRDETEWVETVSHGWNRLWKGPPFLSRREIDEYGDGRAAFRVANLLKVA